MSELDPDMIDTLTAFGKSLLSAADQAAALTLLGFVASSVPAGQCYLSKSGANLLLSRHGGNKLWINAANETIPSAGVSLAPSGLVAGTAYYIYAYMSGATMTLEAATTVPEVNSTTGIRQKTGDATRTLVGIWIATASTTWSAVSCAGASWFNPRLKQSSTAVLSPTTTSATLAELSASLRLDFVTMSGRTPRAEVAGRYGVSVATSDVSADIGLDGITAQLATPAAARNGDVSGNEQAPFFGTRLIAASEGKHYVTALGSVSTGTGSFNGVTIQVTIEG